MLNRNEVTSEVQKSALEYLQFLKRKQSGKVKAHVCADRWMQREYMSKDDLGSPTLSIYALMASCVLSAIDEWKVVTCDFLGDFLQSYWYEDNDCYIKFEGIMV